MSFGRVDAWKIWNSVYSFDFFTEPFLATKSGVETFYENGQHICRSHPFEEPLYGVFDFLPHSKLAGACDGSGHLWSAHVSSAFEFDACISADGKTPYWVERKSLVEANHHVIVRFHTYKAGRPDASQFILPAVCKP